MEVTPSLALNLTYVGVSSIVSFILLGGAGLFSDVSPLHDPSYLTLRVLLFLFPCTTKLLPQIAAPPEPPLSGDVVY